MTKPVDGPGRAEVTVAEVMPGRRPGLAATTVAAGLALAALAGAAFAPLAQAQVSRLSATVAQPAAPVLPEAAAAGSAPQAEAATGSARPLPSGMSRQLPRIDWAWQSQAEFRWWGLLVYQARLKSEIPITAENFAGTPLMLELEYARRFRGQALAERSLQEMTRMQPLTAAQSERWLQQMLQVLPSVNAGDRITAWYRPGQGIRFYLNDTSVGEIPDAEFGRRFLAIWLSDQSPEPSFQQALLGSQP